jgi:hypothetical protein
VVCIEKDRLRAEHAATVKRLRATLKKLNTSSKETAEALLESNAARAECAKARRALVDHRTQHGC